MLPQGLCAALCAHGGARETQCGLVLAPGASPEAVGERALPAVAALSAAFQERLQGLAVRKDADRTFLDERVRALARASPARPAGKPLADGAIAPLPAHLRRSGVTIFSTMEVKQDCEVSLEAFKGGPSPAGMWGADLEDSQVPVPEQLAAGREHLVECVRCMKEDPTLACPVVRLPNLWEPCTFLFTRGGEPVPLFLYCLAQHLDALWHEPEALAFYMPKLESEDEAAWLADMLREAERLTAEAHPEYKAGSIRVLVVVETAHAIYRLQEIAAALHPYFAGASLGWHDFLQSTARVWREDPSWQMPSKLDKDIVTRQVRAQHELIVRTCSAAGGLCIGGMYGVVPESGDSDSLHVSILGLIRETIVQLSRGLTGMWVAHPPFVIIMAELAAAWGAHAGAIEGIIRKHLAEAPHLADEAIHFFMASCSERGPAIDPATPAYAGSLIMQQGTQSEAVHRSAAEIVRTNCAQALRYTISWLNGRGNVLLPTRIGDKNVPAYVVDDFATMERSRWELWRLRSARIVSLGELLAIAFTESRSLMALPGAPKWGRCALTVLIKLVTDEQPVEFCGELLMPLAVDLVRSSENPMTALSSLGAADLLRLDPFVTRWCHYFERCGCERFATAMAEDAALDMRTMDAIFSTLAKTEVIQAASFHGDIGESKQTLDSMGQSEQASVLADQESVRAQLREKGSQYLAKFGFKFLVSAKGESAQELLAILEERLQGTPEGELGAAREALREITHKRVLEDAPDNLLETIQAAAKRWGVASASICLTVRGAACRRGQTLTIGEARSDTMFQVASLSKSVATAFAIEYFKKRDTPLSTSVNSLLEACGSTFRLSCKKWGGAVELWHLVSHCALNMHYVNGTPKCKARHPPVGELLFGCEKPFYEPITVVGEPGSFFKYSGGGFLVLQHIIEMLEGGTNIAEITLPFLRAMGLGEADFHFDGAHEDLEAAAGHDDEGNEVEGSGLVFPAFAAGALGTSRAMMTFLQTLHAAYEDVKGCGPISHDTAVQMLKGTDKGCKEFMGCHMGLGIFTAQAGANRFAIHQGANNGFRALFMYCYKGPDAGAGMVVFATGDNKSVRFIGETAQAVLKTLEVQGIDPSKFQGTDAGAADSHVKQEEIVNLGYKSMVFDACQADAAEPIEKMQGLGPLDPLAPHNAAVGASFVSVSDQSFASATNLISDHLPKFDPKTFGRQGKIMDSWETKRHNFAGCETLVLRLREPCKVRYLSLSTQYHLGNHFKEVALVGLLNGQPAGMLLAKTPMEGHAELRCVCEPTLIDGVRVEAYPDGGLSRLRLIAEGATLPADTLATFTAEPSITVFTDPIPKSKKPLCISYRPSAEEVAQNLSKVPAGAEFDVANAAYGGKVVYASNEHFGPAGGILSPFPPLHMGDGFESARSHDNSHQEVLVIALAKPAKVVRIELDFQFFVNNNPDSAELALGRCTDADGGDWQKATWEAVVPRTSVKAFAGNVKQFTIEKCDEAVHLVRVVLCPDGGVNRIRVWGSL